ncbi:MAG: hypothetical protein ASARMPRED_006369 [Alectoria sarmentosa]|nr:MAG: hypothetical protein ASARMPRED_006369 [Alectoria sarmentosa]
MEAKIKATLGDKLDLACENGDLHTVFEHVALQKVEKSSNTPPFPEMLYTATGKDRLNVVKYCLDNGAVVNDNVMKKLLICRAKETYLFFLESKAVDVDYYISWFGDVLSNVATADDIEWAKLCLAHGADPNRNLVDEHKSILAAVAELASVQMAALLMANGAQVKGSGAIVLAAEEGKLRMVEYLLDHGADIDEIGVEHPTDERYREDMGSALHRAVHGGHAEVVLVLLEKGANVDLKDMMGRTPLSLAQARNDQKLEALLKKHGAVSD